jgi:hypothetical protein
MFLVFFLLFIGIVFFYFILKSIIFAAFFLSLIIFLSILITPVIEFSQQYESKIVTTITTLIISFISILFYFTIFLQV